MKATTKPIFSIISLICLVASYPMARVTADIFVPKEDYLGYGSLGVALITLLSILSVGIILGIISLVHAERPKFLSVAVLLLNGVPLIWLVTKFPL
ncbi:MAG: hypothetical protein KZQ83_10825 [gamma proteobacterium symbiont of Taylorina sp.]|nr:hypothetical protein [gamma proteobacterium symbiont of Taylorina sp.]